MSREAYEAVQDFSNCGDSIGINVLMAIARFVQLGPDGWQEGWVSLREMARLARCDKDTAAAKVHHLETIGEIKTRKEGAGRGTKVWFTLLLPLPERDNNQTLSQPEGDNNEGDNNQTLSQQVKLLSQQIETLSQQVKLLSQLLSQNVPMAPEVEENNTLTPIQEHQEHLNNTPPTPQGVGDGANFEAPDRETEFWGKAQTLVSEWQGLIGDYRPLDANRKQDKSDFFAPALRMINDFGGDYAAAWLAVRAERERMIRDGLGNVRKLSAVVTGVLATLERARLPELDPVHQNGNGRKLSNAETGAVQYAALRQKLVRSKQ